MTAPPDISTSVEQHQLDDASSRRKLSAVARRKIFTALALSSLMVLVVGLPHLGFLFALVLPPLLVWFTYGVYVFVKRPYVRIAQALATAIWLIAIAMLAGIHYLRHLEVRDDANLSATALRHFVARNGYCPRSIDHLALKRSDKLTDRSHAELVYSCIDNVARLGYRVTFTVFDTFNYNLANGTWEYESWARKKGYISP